MFYSQFILAKKGPLGTIWIAAHLERKLRKTQVADTDIGLSVDSILFPDVPIALRLSSHLLLGVVRIYSRKVNYLFDDCSEALLKIKQAFRSTAVDLAPEESTAPYHSITLPETFDLDDFELPDNDILQGNYVDHHVSTKEQITLQDTMDGVVYTTSQFGLDERFGDGDGSHVGLDLEQDMLLDKIIAPYPEEIPEVDPHVSDASAARLVGSFVPLPLSGTSNKKIEGQRANLEVRDYAQGPSTPGLVNEPNLSSVQEGLACDDHLDPEDRHFTESLGIESSENTSMKLDLLRADDAADLLQASHADCETVERMSLDTKENDHDCWDLTDKENMKGNLPDEVAVEGLQEKGDVGDVGDANEVAHCKESSVALNGEHGEVVRVRCHEIDTMDIGIETGGSESHEKAAIPNSIHSLELPGATVPVSLEEAFHEPENPNTLNNHLDDGRSGFSFGSVLQPCSSFQVALYKSSNEINDTMLPCEIPLEDVPCTLGKDEACHPSETCYQGEECLITSSIQGEESQIEPTISTDALADGQCDNVVSVENRFEKLDGSTTFELPALEQLLSVPQMPLDKLDGLLIESLSDKEVLERSDGVCTGAKISGNKRTYRDSMIDMQCLNSADTFGVSKSNRMLNSIPDDDDLLSSILAGRSSVLKIKPSPVAPEVASTKRVRSTSRPSAMKRKVLVDDSMVLLGDTIRQQLINTEDIRRLRKKAPCTRTEILIIERQFLEEDIFHEAVLTGTSLELTRLHCQKYDVSGIEIALNDGNIALFEVEMSKAASHLPSFGENSVVQGDIEPMTSRVIIEGQQIELSAQSKSKQDENHMLHTEDDDMPGLSFARTSEHGTLCERTDGKFDEAFHSRVLETLQNEPISGNVTDTPFGSVTEATFKDKICADASLTMDTLGKPCDEMGNELPEDLSYLGGGISGEGLDGIELLDHKTDNVVAGATDLGTEDEILLAESKVNKSFEITSDVQANVNSCTDDGDTFLVDMSAETARLANDTSVNVAETSEDIGSDKLGYSNEEGGLATTSGYDDKDKMYIYLCGEDNKFDKTNGAGPDRDLDKESLNDKDVNNLDGHELHQQISLNAGYPVKSYVEGQYGDFRDVTFANDTEFLNVDNDEMAEDEDSVAGAEDTQLFDNSGWSLRTRAVAKYLQNLFDKEATYGGKVLSMDDLLTGKTCKEASRMFFETLVLKTKDYIQVEQVKPFNNISIKARAKLMKSDF